MLVFAKLGSDSDWSGHCVCVSALGASCSCCFKTEEQRFSWKLTLVLVAISPFIAVAAVLQGKLLALGAAKSAVANQQISSLAIEVIRRKEDL